MADKNDVTVLLVEDNEVDVMGVQRAFRQSSLTNPIIVAANGLEALTMLRSGEISRKPHLILLDLNMPKMNGIEFLQEVRGDRQLKKSVIFVLTTSNAQEDKEKAYNHNVAGYIVKGRSAGDFVDAAGLLGHYATVCEFP